MTIKQGQDSTEARCDFGGRRGFIQHKSLSEASNLCVFEVTVCSVTPFNFHRTPQSKADPSAVARGRLLEVLVQGSEQRPSAQNRLESWH